MGALTVYCPDCAEPTRCSKGAYGYQKRTCPACGFVGEGMWTFNWHVKRKRKSSKPAAATAWEKIPEAERVIMRRYIHRASHPCTPADEQAARECAARWGILLD